MCGVWNPLRWQSIYLSGFFAVVLMLVPEDLWSILAAPNWLWWLLLQTAGQFRDSASCRTNRARFERNDDNRRAGVDGSLACRNDGLAKRSSQHQSTGRAWLVFFPTLGGYEFSVWDVEIYRRKHVESWFETERGLVFHLIRQTVRKLEKKNC